MESIFRHNKVLLKRDCGSEIFKGSFIAIKAWWQAVSLYEAAERGKPDLESENRFFCWVVLPAKDRMLAHSAVSACKSHLHIFKS